MSKRTTIVLFVLLLSGIASIAHSQTTRPAWTQERIVGLLEEVENLAPSSICDFELRRLPTRPEMIPLVRELALAQGKKPETYVATAERASAIFMSFSGRWWMKGPKERTDSWALPKPGQTADGALFRQIAFDGEFVRSWDKPKDQCWGTIDSPKDANWDNQRREGPTSYFMHGATPFSQFVRVGRDLKIESLIRDGKTVMEVSTLHPRVDSWRVVQVFDESGRLLERRRFHSGLIQDPNVPIEVAVFSDYRPIKTVGGQTLWFPFDMTAHNYMGALNGTNVEWGTEVMKIKDIQFNVDISDDTFDIKFPPGTEITRQPKPEL